MNDQGLTEAELNEEFKKLIEKYVEGYKLMEKEYKTMLEQQKKFPKKFAEKEDFEDLVILASQLKHSSIQLNKNCTALLGSIDIDIDYLESHIVLYFAEDFLKDKFDKVTDQMRKHVLNNKKEMRVLKKNKIHLQALQEAAEKLVRAFEGDEVNCRKFLDLKNKLRGL